MAAAANKPGAVHYFLIFFVMASVILAITTYMFHREASDKFAEISKLNEENQKLNKVQKTLDDQIQALKNKVGIKFEVVDDPNNRENQATVIRGLEAEIMALGPDITGAPATATVFETLRKLKEKLDATAADRKSKEDKVAVLENEVRKLKEQYQQQVDNYSKQTKDAEREKLAVIGDRDEKVNAKIQEISAIKAKLNAATDELAQEKESREKERKALNTQIAEYAVRIDILKDKIDNIEKLSFEAADGFITRVEPSTGTVWINVGEADYVKPRMTFSVYAKENLGVGRGREDIKGKIEVTRIKGPHLAEAKVIEEDLYRPMVSQDLIYTPIWDPGRTERVSVVGIIDFDNDGRSDREQFHQLMALAGCVIDNEVDDEGNRIPEEGKITVQTKFLVKGDIPAPDSVVGEEEKARVTKMLRNYDDMQKEARANGVRVIKLNDFLAYIGYHNKRRTFMPGQQRPYNLKAGAASESTKSISGDRSSNGNVSGSIVKKRQAPQQQSDGTTSKLFGGSK